LVVVYVRAVLEDEGASDVDGAVGERLDRDEQRVVRVHVVERVALGKVKDLVDGLFGEQLLFFQELGGAGGLEDFLVCEMVGDHVDNVVHVLVHSGVCVCEQTQACGKTKQSRTMLPTNCLSEAFHTGAERMSFFSRT